MTIMVLGMGLKESKAKILKVGRIYYLVIIMTSKLFKNKKISIIIMSIIIITTVFFALILWRVNNPPSNDIIIRETVMAGENATIYLNYMPGPQEPPHYRVIVTFSGENVAIPNNEIIDYNWNFGDGNFGTGEVVSHEYPTDQRTYNINLTVIDSSNIEYYYLSTVEILHVF